MTNLLDSIKEHITPTLIAQAASQLGENEGGVSKAIGGLASTILAGLLNKTGDSDSMSHIFNAVSNFDANATDHLGNLLGGGNLAHDDPKDAAGHLLSIVFGAKVPAITNAIASFSGTKSSTVSSLLGLVGPLVMGILNKKTNADSLNASGLAHLLLGQRNSILGALPTGLGSIIGLADMNLYGSDSPGTTGTRWLWPLLLLLGLGGGLMLYLKNCAAIVESPETETTAPAQQGATPVSPR